MRIVKHAAHRTAHKPGRHLDERLVHEGGRLEGVGGRLIPEVAPGEGPQLVVDRVHELRGRRLVASREGGEGVGDVLAG